MEEEKISVSKNLSAITAASGSVVSVCSFKYSFFRYRLHLKKKKSFNKKVKYI